MSLWRKKQISDHEKQLQAVADLLRGNQRSTFSAAGLYNIFLLTIGCALCIAGFGVMEGIGLTMLAVYSRSEA